MIEKIEHIGIAVSNRTQSVELFSRLLGRDPYKMEEVAREDVRTVFFQLGESKLELLEATSEQSAVHKFLLKNREGIHHLALSVRGIEQEIERLKAEGFEFIHDVPRPGADGKKVVFIHPRSANGILVELCEDMSDHGME